MISIRRSYWYPHVHHENSYCVNVDFPTKKIEIKRYMIVVYTLMS